jgi:hypothetical protein
MATTFGGHIEKLPSGSFRVHVYAGIDPVTGKPRRLRQTCPDEAAAVAALGQLLGQADGGRFPDRGATLGQALDKYLEVKLARRPEWDNCLDHLRAGDELAVTRLSRMARSVRHLTETAGFLADRGIELVVLKQGIDTTTSAGRFTFHVLAEMDEMLAGLISEGTREGRESARAAAGSAAATQTEHPAGRGGPRHVRRDRRRRQAEVHCRRDRRNLRRVPQNRLPAPRTIRIAGAAHAAGSRC